MNVACPGTWRAVCTASLYASSKQLTPAVSIWGPTITPSRIIRSFHSRLSPHRSHSQRLRTLLCRVEFLSSSSSSVTVTARASQVRSWSTTSPHYGWLFKSLEISPDDVAKIFGKDMSATEGNQIIRRVQEQRLDGTIDQITERQDRQALAWLRKTKPVDEDAAILDRLEREERIALDRETGKGPYAESAFERLRKRNIAKRERKEEEAKARAKLEGSDLPISREQALVQQQQARDALVKRWQDEAKEYELHSVPQMSIIERVGPVTIVTAGVIFLSVMFAQNYVPPSQAARLFSSISPATATISVLIGMNCLVWFGWRVLPIRKTMMKVFCLVPAYPYVSSMVGNLFSHEKFNHLLGALAAIIATWCCINQDRGIRIWPFEPRVTERLQPLVFLAALIAVDIYGLVKGFRLGRVDRNIDHVSHLAGYAAGTVAAQFVRPTAPPKQKERAPLLAPR
ncbi:MAG: hypothetical protein L6R39_006577 [Caloplaca ligustica]|nr:MAG: hypothetical protein L6R39_006577 [Caloplaca ligustica]